jgi:hypothetical protein
MKAAVFALGRDIHPARQCAELVPTDIKGLPDDVPRTAVVQHPDCWSNPCRDGGSARRRWHRAHLGPNFALTFIAFATNIIFNAALVITLVWLQSRASAF